ncbi:MAG: ASPIC/UnbV domain-containing protein, partial [Kiritimatiellia bacterium]
QDRPMMMQNMGPNNGYTFVNRWTLDGTQYQESYAVPMSADYDNDGDLDLFFTTVYAGDTSRLWRNDGNWNFTDVTASSGLPSDLGRTYGAAWGDINNDGFPDLLTNNKLFINQGNANKWLKVRLLGNGATVNRSAIGAQVRIALSNKTLIRQVEGASGKASQNEMTLHFGLGSSTTPVDLMITWPDCSEQTVEDVALNQTLTVTAPAAMSVSVQSLSPSAERGADAAAQSFTVQSDSLQPMAFAVSDNAAWLSLSPASGTAEGGAAESVQVTYDTDALAAGTYNATITVTSADVTNSPQTVAVTLTVVPQAGDLPVVETFENYAAGTLLASIGGWSGDPAASVAALAYTPALPPGYPVPSACVRTTPATRPTPSYSRASTGRSVCRSTHLNPPRISPRPGRGICARTRPAKAVAARKRSPASESAERAAWTIWLSLRISPSRTPARPRPTACRSSGSTSGAWRVFRDLITTATVMTRPANIPQAQTRSIRRAASASSTPGLRTAACICASWATIPAPLRRT